MNQPIARDDAGTISAELVVLVPMLVLGMVFVVYAGRLGQAELDVFQASAEAARAASLARDGDAAAAASATVQRDLAGDGVRCVNLSVDTTTSTRGPVATVTVRVACAVDLVDVGGVGLPRNRTITAQATEVLDVYRGDDGTHRASAVGGHDRTPQDE